MSINLIENKIYFLRGRKVILDRDLAELYGVETRRLNEQVRRNIERFPSDFMFQLSKTEVQIWMSQIAISNKERMGLRKPPLAFTEQGIAMLSGLLSSKTAVQVNIQIMRAFVRLRELMAANAELREKIEDLERALDQSGFLRNKDMRPSMVLNLRALLQRAEMTEQEARTFHGVIKFLSKSKHEE